MSDIIETLRRLGCSVEPCGSRETCNPPPTNTDQDYLVVTPYSFWGKGAVLSAIEAAGFDTDTQSYSGQRGQFESWRKDDINLIITADTAFAARHRAATHVCKRLNPLSKDDRVMVFQAALYAATAAEVTE